MATNKYNGTPAETEVIHKGTPLYRIMSASASYGANSFNPTSKFLGDPKQGRFEPTRPELGGYIYLATTDVGAVAEGVLRNKAIPPSRVVRRVWLRDKKFAVMELEEDVTVARLYGSHAAMLDLDASFLCSPPMRYSRTRQTATDVLVNTPEAQGIMYPCRNNEQSTALMLVSRNSGAVLAPLKITRELNILTDDEGFTLVTEILDQRFKLKYPGTR